MIDLVKKIADVRTEGDASYKASQDLKDDAIKFYKMADRLWAAKIVAEKIRGEFMKIGHVELEPDLINKTVDDSIEMLINGGHLW